MLWGLLILVLLVAAIAVGVALRGKSAQKKAVEDRRRRFAIQDTGERVPMAPERELVAAIPVSDEGSLPIPSPRVIASAPPAVQGRIVHTPDGEMMLTTPPFVLREALFTSKTGRFVNLLSRRVPAWVMICPRVRLDSLLTPTKPDGRDPADWRDWRRRVRVRSVDLVLCDRRAWKPLVAVLLVPKAGVDARRVAGGNDQMIDEVLTAAGLPLLRLTGDFEKDWPLIKPYVEESILPHMTDEQVLEASMQTERISGDAAVELLRLDQEKGWMLE